MQNPDNNDTFLHPLISSSFGNLVALVARYGCEPRHVPKLLYLFPMTLLRQPLVTWERLRFGARIEKQPVEPPVFVVGHWRSGTTHLQNLLCRDPQFAQVSLMQAGMPHDFLTFGAFAKRRFAKHLPTRRLMDNVPVSADVPWEEELALTSTGRMSFYHVSFFPKWMDRIFTDAILFDGDNPDLLRLWQKQYFGFLRKVQFAQPGKQLLLKNPANTARIRQLRKMFPGSRFIHIHRDPYEVFASSVHLYLKAQVAWGLHETSRDLVVRHVLNSYPRLMNAYFDQRTSLGPGEIVEVSFQSLCDAPLDTLRYIYREIHLPGYEEAGPRFKDYLESQRNYRRNQLSLDPGERETIREKWAPIIERLGYPP